MRSVAIAAPVSAGVSGRIETVRGKLAKWRRSRRRGERMPEKLWAQATALGRERGVAKTVRELGLDYYSLKKRVEAAGLEREAAKPAFVEFVPTIRESEWLVEIASERGTRMRIQCKGGTAPDLAGLSASLWRATR